MNSVARLFLFLNLLIFIGVARAQLTIEITKGVERALPIAIVPFGTPDAVPEDIAEIISSDLRLSGRFDPLPPQAYSDRPVDFSELSFPNWRALGVDHVVVGQLRPKADGGYWVKFELAEVFQGNRLLGLSFEIGRDQLRRLAHQISDLVYEKITGERGAFDTRIAYVSATRQAGGGTYTLVVADMDGYNPQIVLRSALPVMSPAWSPDGRRLAYVSFEGRKSQIIVQDLYSGARQTVSVEPGINGAPAWSPDGRRLAFTLSKDGDPEVYIYEMASGRITRLTSSSGIDTEPTWSPDGRSIVFTSDRGGSPQLYRVDLTGSRPERLTFEGEYNARARFSPDGRTLALVHRGQGGFRIAVMDLATRNLRVLTNGRLDESPSFAPNGRVIIYATSERGRGILAAVSVDGGVQQTLVARERDIREPAWSPYSHR